LAEHYKVCVHPLALRRIDNETGLTEIVDIPCGARLASKCAPCAERNQRLRRQQIREGWHLADEPDPAPEPASEEVIALVQLRCQFVFDRDQAQREADWPGVAELDNAIDELDRYVSTLRVSRHPGPSSRPGQAAPYPLDQAA
jgi:hypothetical protein